MKVKLNAVVIGPTKVKSTIHIHPTLKPSVDVSGGEYDIEQWPDVCKSLGKEIHWKIQLLTQYRLEDVLRGSIQPPCVCGSLPRPIDSRA